MASNVLYSGFTNPQQETIYNKFVFKLIALLAEELFAKKRSAFDGAELLGKSTCALSDRLFDIEANNESLYDKFEKRIIKIYRAMRVMEQAKHTEPRFSDAFKELARFLNDTKKSMGGDTMSRFSSVGETFKMKGDADSLSNFGGISTVFGNFALINSSC